MRRERPLAHDFEWRGGGGGAVRTSRTCGKRRRAPSIPSTSKSTSCGPTLSV